MAGPRREVLYPPLSRLTRREVPCPPNAGLAPSGRPPHAGLAPSGRPPHAGLAPSGRPPLKSPPFNRAAEGHTAPTPSADSGTTMVTDRQTSVDPSAPEPNTPDATRATTIAPSIAISAAPRLVLRANQAASIKSRRAAAPITSLGRAAPADHTAAAQGWRDPDRARHTRNWRT